MLKVSLLIPIYNASDYLSQSLNSAIHQTLKEIEIICLNDGSTDDSIKIIHKYATKDSRIIIVNKLNSGYGDTMNHGVKIAKGKYLAILEPDDYLDPNALQYLYELAENKNADIVKCNFFREEQGKSIKTQYITTQDAKEVHNYTYQNLFSLPPAIWAALYRREFILGNNIRFLPTPRAAFQDLGFNFKTIALAKRIMLSTEAYLHYRVDNPNSSSNSSQKAHCVVEEYSSIEHFLKQHNLYDELGHSMMASKFRNYYWNWQRLNGDNAKKFYQTMRNELLFAKNDHLLRRSDFSLKHWLAIHFILNQPKLAAKILHK